MLTEIFEIHNRFKAEVQDELPNGLTIRSNGKVYDENNNAVTIDIQQFQNFKQAEIMRIEAIFASLVNCSGCVDCAFCEQCHACYACAKCYYCDDCKLCENYSYSTYVQNGGREFIAPKLEC